jgi:hypothetical protein
VEEYIFVSVNDVIEIKDNTILVAFYNESKEPDYELWIIHVGKDSTRYCHTS